MKHREFYIVGGVLVFVGLYLYYTKNKLDTKKAEDLKTATAGQLASVPPVEASTMNSQPSGLPSLSTPTFV